MHKKTIRLAVPIIPAGIIIKIITDNSNRKIYLGIGWIMWQSHV